MKNLKIKIAALMFAVMLIASSLLASCGGNKEKPTDDTTQKASSETETGEQTTEELKPELPDANYDGTSIRIITANEEGNGIDIGVLAEEATDKINEAVYKRDRNVEDNLGVTLEVNLGSSYPDAYNILHESTTAGSDDFDLGFIRTDTAFIIASEGGLVDLSDYGYINTQMPWWDNKVNDYHTIGGKLYAGVGAITVNDLLRTHMILFNSKLFDDKGIEYPYADVIDGSWTIDKLGNFAKTLNTDVNGDQVVDMANDIFGFSSYSWTSGYTLWYGCGGSVIDKDENDIPVVSMDTEKIEKIYSAMYDAVVNSGSNLVSDGSGYTDMYNSFTDGRVYLTEACMMHLTHWESFRDMKDDYGIIPTPKLNEEQKDYISYAEVVEPAVCVPYCCQTDSDMLSAVIEDLAYEAYKLITPAVYQVSLKDKFARDEQSKKMLDIISENRCSCLATVFISTTSFTTSLPSMLANHTDGITVYIDKYRDAMTNALEKAMVNFTN